MNIKERLIAEREAESQATRWALVLARALIAGRLVADRRCAIAEAGMMCACTGACYPAWKAEGDATIDAIDLALVGLANISRPMREHAKRNISPGRSAELPRKCLE